MVFWEAEEPALILRHRAHQNGTDKIKLIDIFSQNSIVSRCSWFILFTRQRFFNQVYTVPPISFLEAAFLLVSTKDAVAFRSR